MDLIDLVNLGILMIKVNSVISMLVLMVDIISWSGEYDVSGGSGGSVDLVMMVKLVILLNLVVPFSLVIPVI